MPKSGNVGRTATSPKPEEGLLLRRGPWGDVQCISFNLEVPEECLSLQRDEESKPRWFFGDWSQGKTEQFLAQTSLTASQKQQLADSGKWEPATNGIWLTIPQEVILSMSSQTRQEIYSVLAQFPENFWQHEEIYSMPVGDADRRFEDSGLSSETIALVKRLLYPRGKLLLFSDLPTVLKILPSHKEALQLEKALSRRPTMLLRIRVPHGGDVDALLAYWGRAGETRHLRTLFESLAKLPGGATLDICNILPPMPAARLYTFPFPAIDQPENCHWTSFNFFRDLPEGSFNDLALVQKKLASDYYPVFSDPRYGDLVFLTKPNGEVIHSCVYIADDIVFTKNGGHFREPWVLMRLPQLLNIYSMHVAPNEEVGIGYYRNKYY